VIASEVTNTKVMQGAVRGSWRWNVGVVGTTKISTLARAEPQIRFIRRKYSVLVVLRNHVAQSFLMPMQSRADVPVTSNIPFLIQNVLLFWIEG